MHLKPCLTSTALINNGFTNIQIPNDKINQLGILAVMSTMNNVKVFAETCYSFLTRCDPSIKFQVVYLDYCGGFDTYKKDIKLLIKHLYTGLFNQGALMALTFHISRGNENNIDCINGWTEGLLKSNDMTYERILELKYSSSMYTVIYITRNKYII